MTSSLAGSSDRSGPPTLCGREARNLSSARRDEPALRGDAVAFHFALLHYVERRNARRVPQILSNSFEEREHRARMTLFDALTSSASMAATTGFSGLVCMSDGPGFRGTASAFSGPLPQESDSAWQSTHDGNANSITEAKMRLIQRHVNDETVWHAL